MLLYVVAFPVLTPADEGLIDGVRALFDPQRKALAPHLTFLFGIERLWAEPIVMHVESIARRVARFACVFRRTSVVADPIEGRWCVFLVPVEGSAEVTALHDALYTGALAGELRRDIPFVPHVTVGRFPSEQDAQGLASSLAAGPLAVHTAVEALEILAVEPGAPIRSIRTVRLALLAPIA